MDELHECRTLCSDLLEEVLRLRQKIDKLTEFAEARVADCVVLEEQLAELNARRRNPIVRPFRRVRRNSSGVPE